MSYPLLNFSIVGLHVCQMASPHFLHGAGWNVGNIQWPGLFLSDALLVKGFWFSVRFRRLQMRLLPVWLTAVDLSLAHATLNSSACLNGVLSGLEVIQKPNERALRRDKNALSFFEGLVTVTRSNLSDGRSQVMASRAGNVWPLCYTRLPKYRPEWRHGTAINGGQRVYKRPTGWGRMSPGSQMRLRSPRDEVVNRKPENEDVPRRSAMFVLIVQAICNITRQIH